MEPYVKTPKETRFDREQGRVSGSVLYYTPKLFNSKNRIFDLGKRVTHDIRHRIEVITVIRYVGFGPLDPESDTGGKEEDGSEV